MPIIDGYVLSIFWISIIDRSFMGEYLYVYSFIVLWTIVEMLPQHWQRKYVSKQRKKLVIREVFQCQLLFVLERKKEKVLE